jgi:hypothetical protein
MKKAKSKLLYVSMKKPFILSVVTALIPVLAFAADYNLGRLATSDNIELFNRALDRTKAGAPDVLYLNSAPGYGLAWVSGVEFSNGTIELEMKGKNVSGQSFVGIAFHGQDNTTFDAVYLRPFNFQAAETEHRSHSIQYISLPQHDWDELRKNYPGKYESLVSPPPAPESWFTLRLEIHGKNLSAFVNGADKPSLKLELLNNRRNGKLGLWVGNGSDGRFRNLKITPAAK